MKDKTIIRWKKTSVGGYMAKGGALLRSWSAYITPSDDSCIWYASLEVDGKYTTSATHKSARAAKQWCRRLIA